MDIFDRPLPWQVLSFMSWKSRLNVSLRVSWLYTVVQSIIDPVLLVLVLSPPLEGFSHMANVLCLLLALITCHCMVSLLMAFTTCHCMVVDIRPWSGQEKILLWSLFHPNGTWVQQAGIIPRDYPAPWNFILGFCMIKDDWFLFFSSFVPWQLGFIFTEFIRALSVCLSLLVWIGCIMNFYCSVSFRLSKALVIISISCSTVI